MYSIMIVDDNETELVIAQKTLQDNYRVIPMNNPKSALTRLSKATVPDMIILDVEMPVINGFEMMTRIRTSDNPHKIKVAAKYVKSSTYSKINFIITDTAYLCNIIKR